MSLFDYDYEKAFEGDETVTVAKPDATVATADGSKIDDVTSDVDKNENVAATTTAATNTATEGGRAKNPKGKKAKRRHSVKEDGEADNPAELTDDEVAGLDGEETDAPSDAVDKEMDPAAAEEDDEVENPTDVTGEPAPAEGGVDGDEADEVPAEDSQPAAEDGEVPEPALPAQPAPDDTIANAPAEMPAADVAAAITPAEKAEDVAAASNDAGAVDVTDVQGAPAVDECKEQANFFCLEQVKVNIAFDKVDRACTEAWVKSGTDYQKAVVTENFKESTKKYWERFKAFCVRMKNLIKRTAIRVMNYVKQLFYKAVAKITAKMGTKAMIAYRDKYSEVAFNSFSNVTLGLGAYVEAIKKASNEELGKVDSLLMPGATVDDVKKAREDWNKNKDSIEKAILGEKKELHGKDFGKLTEIIRALREPSFIFKAIKVQLDTCNGQIKRAEDQVSKAKDLDTTEMTAKLSAINLAVSEYTTIMSLLNRAAIAWLRARVHVAMSIIGKGMKSKLPGGKKKEEKEPVKASYDGSDLLTQFMSTI